MINEYIIINLDDVYNIIGYISNEDGTPKIFNNKADIFKEIKESNIFNYRIIQI